MRELSSRDKKFQFHKSMNKSLLILKKFKYQTSMKDSLKRELKYQFLKFMKEL